MKLTNKSCIVTGGGQGIGKAVCMAFAKEGASVLVADMVSQTAKQVSDEIKTTGGKCAAFELDVSNPGQVKEMVEFALKNFGSIDVLANVAGIAKRSAIEDLSEEDFNRVIAVNLKGTFLCCQAVGREMIKRGGGAIVNIASVAGHTPQVYLGAYGPSKAGVLSLTRLMSLEWAKHHIRVNSISPGPINTPLVEKVYYTEALRFKRTRSIPMNRFGNPEEIAAGAVFLASDASSYITGADIVIDGGSINGLYYLTDLLSS
jgi:NAD(P)-dependent dehydrogenase (short-subunit alcohol dehydrogenase family)